jgi:hypothetical protein
MDGSHFDTLARSIAYGGTRRRLMTRLLGGVVLGAPLALLGQGDHAAKGKKGKGKKRGGRGASADCNGDRRRGDACTDSCQCRGDYRCGAPRPAGQRVECGQNQDAREVCCLGQGDSCNNNNDCECCGTLVCLNGRCRDVAGTTCAPGKVYHLGTCIGNGVCGPGTGGQLGCGPAACGADIPSPTARSECYPTTEGGLVCIGRFDNGTAAEFPRCKRSADCPANQVCRDRQGASDFACYPVCGPR